ncbi:hypothetical protein HDU97_004331 [Phlyctochytrium planicorne]|nr:hypothetical protein HDU97_004331 [Phlyctochytrium planicorne]
MLSDTWDFELENSLLEQQDVDNDAASVNKDGTVCVREASPVSRPKVPTDWQPTELVGANSAITSSQNTLPSTSMRGGGMATGILSSIESKPWMDIFAGDLISGSDFRSLVSELGMEDDPEDSFVQDMDLPSVSLGDIGASGKPSLNTDNAEVAKRSGDAYPSNIDDVEVLTEDSGSVRHSLTGPMNRGGNLRTIRPMNGTCKLQIQKLCHLTSAFSAALSLMMQKLGNDHNMHFNEEKKCWEGSDEQLILDDDAASAFSGPGRNLRKPSNNGALPVSLQTPPVKGRESLNRRRSLAWSEDGDVLKIYDTSSTERPPLPLPLVANNMSLPSSQNLPFTSPPPAFHNIPSSAQTAPVADNNANASLSAIMTSAGIRQGAPKEIKELILQGCNLASVTSLDTFVKGLDKIDLSVSFAFEKCLFQDKLIFFSILVRSDNALMYLDGVPESVSVLIGRNNRISSLTSFKKLQFLSHLDVSFNDLSDLSAISHLPLLKILNANNNRIISLRCLKTCENLETVSLENNIIKTLDLYGAKMKSLSALNLAGNNLEVLENCESLEFLENLNLSRNRISKIRLQSKVPQLKRLDLHSNKLDFLKLEYFPSLEFLNLCNNSVATISGGNSTLLHLDVSHQLTPRSYVDFNGFLLLRIVDVSGVPIGSLSCFSELYNLRTLKASNCCLTDIDDTFATMVGTTLEVVDLSKNKIVTVKNMRAMAKLQVLDLSDNALFESAGTLSAISQMGDLKVLDLRFNPISIKFYPAPKAEEPRMIWEKRDSSFRAALNDSDFVRRACYRNTIIARLGSSLAVLDCIEVTEQDKRKAARFFAKLKANLKNHQLKQK